MEQFHHPRPVGFGDRGRPHPTSPRAAAKAVAADLATPVRLLDGDLTRLPARDASCDVVVCSLILCCSSRVAETYREIRRVLRPGGELRFYEHQRSSRWPVALLSGLVAPIWSRAAGGCHAARDTSAAMEQAGFGVEDVERFAFRGFDHVVGVARPRGRPVQTHPYAFLTPSPGQTPLNRQ